MLQTLLPSVDLAGAPRVVDVAGGATGVHRRCLPVLRWSPVLRAALQACEAFFAMLLWALQEGTIVAMLRGDIYNIGDVGATNVMEAMLQPAFSLDHIITDVALVGSQQYHHS